MATRITQCPLCKSCNIKELNPEIRETEGSPLCTINCSCNDCSATFTIQSWTRSGKNKGILY
jgi:hypothetical protein